MRHISSSGNKGGFSWGLSHRGLAPMIAYASLGAMHLMPLFYVLATAGVLVLKPYTATALSPGGAFGLLCAILVGLHGSYSRGGCGLNGVGPVPMLANSTSCSRGLRISGYMYPISAEWVHILSVTTLFSCVLACGSFRGSPLTVYASESSEASNFLAASTGGKHTILYSHSWDMWGVGLGYTQDAFSHIQWAAIMGVKGWLGKYPYYSEELDSSYLISKSGICGSCNCKGVNGALVGLTYVGLILFGLFILSLL